MSEPRTGPHDPAHPNYQRELGFAPCRDEDCPREVVHPEHEVAVRTNGKVPRTCPRCLTKLEPPDPKTKAISCPCGWTRPGRGNACRRNTPAPSSKRASGTRAVSDHFIADLKLDDGLYRCPPFNHGGCNGRGWRKDPAKPCRICDGSGKVSWSPAELIDFLTTPAVERRAA